MNLENNTILTHESLNKLLQKHGEGSKDDLFTKSEEIVRKEIMTEERKQKAKNFQIKIRPKNNKLHMQRNDTQDKIISKEELAKYSSRNQNKFEDEKYKTKDSNKGMKQDKLEKELIV